MVENQNMGAEETNPRRPYFCVTGKNSKVRARNR